MEDDGLNTRFQELSLEELEGLVAEEQEENLHLDFKTLNGSSLKSSDDKANFAKALSGFANSDGGMVVWGVDARGNADGMDCATSLEPVEDVSLLLTRLNSLTSDMVSPSVDGVQHRIVHRNDDASGFVATLVPCSDSGPHMAKGRLDRYYKRSGDSFLKMEHFDVADMFGRRPHPALSLSYSIHATGDRTFRVVLSIENTGRGTARAPYLTVHVKKPHSVDYYGIDGNKTEGLSRLSLRGAANVQYGGMADTVIHPRTQREICAISGEVDESESQAASDISLEYELASEDFPLAQDTLVVPGSEIVRAIVRT